MAGRTDLDRYPYAVKSMLNFLPRPQGPATRRSGTRYVANTRSDNQAVLIPFVRDANTAYIIEATLGYFRFYRDEGVVNNHDEYDFVPGDVDFANDEIEIDDHGYTHGQGPFRLTTTNTLPAGLSTGTDYYIVLKGLTNSPNTDWFGLSLTRDGSKVTITDAGTGTHTITPYPDTALMEIAHTYTLAELQELDYAQSIDVLFLAQQNHPPRELQRYSETDWRLVDVPFEDGPYLGINRTDTTLQSSGTSGSVTITASSTEGINGGLGFRDPEDIGRHVWIRKKDASTNVGWAIITSVTSTTIVVATTQEDVTIVATKDWRLGAFYAGNYPAAVTFFEQRLVFGGTPGEPENIWASRTGDFYSFSPVTQEEEGAEDEGSVLDDTALAFTLAVSDDVQIVRWLKATRQLLCGCTAGIAPVQASQLREPVTPTNINAFLSSSQGVKQTRPILVEEAVVYLGADGKRLFQSEYASASDTFKSEELSIRAEHIMASKADRLAYAKDPDSVVWVRKEDGTLAAMTFIKNEEVLGWSRHEIGGSYEGGDAVIESLAAIPTIDEDHTQLWLAVKRTVDGATVRHIEFMEEMFTTLGGKDIRDAYMVDCGLSYDSPVDVEGATAANPVVVTVPSGHGLLDGDAIEIEGVEGMTEINGLFTVGTVLSGTSFFLHDEDDSPVDGSGFSAWERGGEIRVRVTSICGLDHLEGEDVKIVADGAYRGLFTVVSGEVTFGEPAAAIVHAGLAYDSDLILLTPNYTAMQASASGKLKRLAQVVIRLDESAGGRCGMEGGTLDPVLRRSVDDPLGEPVPLESGDIRTQIDVRWGKMVHLHIQQDLPMPFTVLAVMLDAIQDQA